MVIFLLEMYFSLVFRINYFLRWVRENSLFVCIDVPCWECFFACGN